MNNSQSFREEIIDGVRHAYDTIADHFSATRQFQWEEVEFLVEQYVKPGETLLDIGCGNGRVAQIAERIKAQYVGIDISPRMVELTKKQHPWATAEVADMRKIPLADESVDDVIAVASFHHLPDRTSRIQALQEMARVVKPGGYVMLLNWNLLRWSMLTRRLYSVWLQVSHGRREYGWRDVHVPWKDGNRTHLADRYYHAFSKKEVRRLGAHARGLRLVDDYYELRGLHVPRRRGANLVTIFMKDRVG
jgi:ubiquinone/menaquinone biosynthesis C-methylase UbiE